MQGEEINLPDRTPVRAHLRIHARRQRDLAEAFQNPLPVPVVVRFVVENQLQVGKSKQRERAQVHHMRDAVHYYFERNRDLLLDLLRRNPRPLRNHLNVVVGYVGISLNGQPLERNDAARKKDQRQPQDQRVLQRQSV